VKLSNNMVTSTLPQVRRVKVMLQTYTRVLQALLQARKIIRYSYMLLYIIRIMNKCIVSLIFNKMLCCVNCQSKFLMWFEFWCWTIGFLLVERWKREIHTFHFCFREMTPILQDVVMLVNLPIDGNP
jgi:hypothetical protein